jgi:hypothetical protein
LIAKKKQLSIFPPKYLYRYLEKGVGAHGDDVESKVELCDVEEGPVVGGVDVLPLPHLHEAHLLPLLGYAEQAHIVLNIQPFEQ